MRAFLLFAIPAALLAADPSFHKDIAPILQKHCQTCHRPGEVAPMSFLTYESTRPWAKAMKAATLSKKMPPWPIDTTYGKFANDLSLSKAEVDLIAKWADAGAPAGNAKDAPPHIQWTEGWTIKPDVIVEMSKAYAVPATGEIPIPGFILPSPFKEDTWVEAIEIRPGNRSVVHHVTLTFPPKRPDVKYGEPSFGDLARANPSTPPSGAIANPANAANPNLGNFTNFEAVWVPGVPPSDYIQHGAAKLIPAGTDIRIGVHYTPNGKATTDITSVGFKLAKNPPQKRFITMSPSSPGGFKIPANEANYESATEVVFNEPVDLVWFMPHMHLRGKDMTYVLTYPTGEKQTVLKSFWDFEWQLGYDAAKPIQVPKGSRLTVTAHYDNSRNNRYNPDPNQDVSWGDQTSQEMMVPWFGVVVDRGTDPRAIASYTPEYAPVNRRGR